MKYFTGLFILSIFLFKIAKTQDFHVNKIAESEKQSVKAFFINKQEINNSATDIIYHDINWEVNPAEYYIKGNISHVFKITKDATSKIFVDLSEPLKVDSILHSTGPLTYTHKNSIITITLAKELNLNDIDTVTIYYQGEPAMHSDNFGSFETNKHNDTPILWTLSEPYGAKDWWPCKQNLNDKIDSIDIKVTVPTGNKVGSNGILVSEKIENGKVTYHWKHRHPIATYLIAIAVTNYVEFTDIATLDNGDQVDVLNYIYPENLDDFREDAKFTTEVIELFSQLFIPYPFKDEKYGHAQFGWGGGMEHQTMSFMYHLKKDLVAHELAHQWFGDHVTCGSWKDIWVNEGFATYLTGLTYEHLIPDLWMAWKENNMGQVENNGESGSVYVDDTTSVDRIFNSTLSYKKGAAVLHMLRYQIGDEAFFKGCQLLLSQPETSKGFAKTNDVQTAFEQAADTTLNEFFESWIYGEGYPKYKISWLQDMNNNIDLNLIQTPTHESVNCFKMKVPVLFIGENKELLMHFNHKTPDEQFSFNPGFKVTKVEFDPEYNILAPHPAWIVVNIEENQINSNVLKLYPNPANHELIIKTDKNNLIQQFEIFSNNGKQIYTGLNHEQKRKINLNIGNLNSGIYYVRVLINDNELVKQFVKN